MDSVLDTIHEYYRVFSGLNLEAIVSYFSEPCLNIAPAGAVHAVANRQELLRIFGPVLDELRSHGYGRSEYAQPQVTSLGSSAALVSGIAVRYLAAGPELQRVRISYVMTRNAGAWKIASMIFEGSDPNQH